MTSNPELQLFTTHVEAGRKQRESPGLSSHCLLMKPFPFHIFLKRQADIRNKKNKYVAHTKHVNINSNFLGFSINLCTHDRQRFQ